MIESLSICAVALVTEALIGYPAPVFRAIGHPVTWMGATLSWLDRERNRDSDPPGHRRAWGLFCLCVLVVLVGFLTLSVDALLSAVLSPAMGVLSLGILASTCLAQRSLHTHVEAVAHALDHEGLEAARRAVGAIVGRDTARLDEAGVARAAIESLAENFADGVVAPAFWLALFGLPGAMLYKAVNTADSMIGHRTPRHEAFGFAAAKLDDIVNWVPARLAVLWLTIAAGIAPGASAAAAWRVTARDARGHPSPNAGWPEAAMAGALGLRLGGARSYGGRTLPDRDIGDGDRPVDARAIRAALHLYRLACGVEIGVVVVLALVIAQWR